VTAFDAPSTFAAGDRVGPYILEGALGEGAFGKVFRAREDGSGRVVALKLLSAAANADSDTRARFKREARLLSKLRHGSTVRVLDAGETGRGTPFIVFELLIGESLEQVLARGPLPDDDAIRVVSALLGSLAEAHEAGIVHRDVKPANIFLCPEGGERVKLLDFGVAKVLANASTHTPEGVVVGTPSYMAPEQIAAKDVTPAADLYAIGLVLAEMLTGRPMYEGSAIKICVSKLQGDEAPLDEQLRTSALGGHLARATAFEPRQRFASAREMLAEIVAKRLGNEATAPNPTPLRQPAPGGRLAVDAHATTATILTPRRPAPAGDSAVNAYDATAPVRSPRRPAPPGGRGAVNPYATTAATPVPPRPARALSTGTAHRRTGWRVPATAAAVLAALGLAALIGSSWFRAVRIPRASSSALDVPASSSADVPFHIEAAKHRTPARDLTPCEGTDRTKTVALLSKLRSVERWGKEKRDLRSDSDWTYHFQPVNLSIRFFGPNIPEGARALAERAAAHGYAVFVGQQNVIIVDAPPPERELIRRAICD